MEQQTDAVQSFLENFNHALDTLPDPEDLLCQDEIKFVGMFVMMTAALERMSNANTPGGGYVSPYFVERESALEEWVESARDFLPEWACGVTIS